VPNFPGCGLLREQRGAVVHGPAVVHLRGGNALGAQVVDQSARGRRVRREPGEARSAGAAGVGNAAGREPGEGADRVGDTRAVAPHRVQQRGESPQLYEAERACDFRHAEVVADERHAGLGAASTAVLRHELSTLIVESCGALVEVGAIGGDEAALAGGDVLRLLEGECTDVADRADGLAAVRDTDGLGRIFEHRDAVCARDRKERVHVARDVLEVDRNDRNRPRPDLGSYVGRIERQRVVDLGEHRHRA
jgi:hypothetical protein